MSPVLVAVITVLFALVIVTTEKVFGLLFLGSDNVEGADSTHTGGVGDVAGEAPGEADGELPGDGLASTVGSGDGSAPGDGEGFSVGDGDGDVSGEGLGLAEGSEPSMGLADGLPETTVEGVELSVISAISLSGNPSVPMVISPEPER